MAIVDKETCLDPSEIQERHGIERQRFLEQRVAETLALKPSMPCPLLKGQEHGSYKPILQEEQRDIRAYERRSRQVRIMQVRAQEMLLAAQRVGEFRQRKKQEKQKLLQVLKEAWQEEQKKRIADIEADFANSYKGIGRSHEAAQDIIKGMSANAEEKMKRAEENRIWEALRYQRAMEEESVRKSEVKVDLDQVAAVERRRLIAFAADVERTQARNCALRAKSKAADEEKRNAGKDGRQNYLQLNFNSQDLKRDFIQLRLAGSPNDYKDTYFHSRFCVLKDRTNLNSCAKTVHEEQVESEVDAWEAAEEHLKSADLGKEQKVRMEEVWKELKLERGQVAGAHLQKIALLEKELAVELGEEQERRHQLQLIEELSKAAHVSKYKPDYRRRVGPKPLSPNEEVGDREAPKTEESDQSTMTEPVATMFFVAGESLDLGSAEARQLAEEDIRERENGAMQTVWPDQDIGKSCNKNPQEANSSCPSNNDATVREDQGVHCKGAEMTVVRLDDPKVPPTRMLTPNKPLTPRKVAQSEAEMRMSPYASPMTIKGTRLGRKYTAHSGAAGAPTNADSKNCDHHGQRVCAPARTSKGPTSTSQVSPLPNVSLKTTIKKGNKSPERLNSPGKTVPTGQESGATADKVKLERSRSRQKTGKVIAEIPDKKPLLPAIPRRMESSFPEGKKASPRRHGNTWLTNVLEKLTWWKSSKGLPLCGILATQDKAEDCLSCPGEQAVRAANREIRKESIPKFPVKHIDSASRPQTVNNSIPVQSNCPENTKSNSQAGCASDKTGWYEACTKDLFSPEELEALQLELYGMWTDNAVSVRNKTRTKREKVKAGTGKLDNDFEITLEEEQNLPHMEDLLKKSKDPSFKEMTENFTPCIRSSAAANGAECLLTSDLSPKDESCQLKEQTPVHEVPTTWCSKLKGDMVDQTSERLTTESESLPHELTSARDAAEQLIHAWRTGRIGGSLCSTSNHVNLKSRQMSRKRIARTDEESHLDPSRLGTLQKSGQTTSSLSRPLQGLATKFRKWEASGTLSQNTSQIASSLHKQKSQNAWMAPTKIFSALYSSSQQSLPLGKIESSGSNNLLADVHPHRKEVIPEARSLDFILGSLSAQVKELDGRLQNVTTYATGAQNHFSAEISSPLMEHSTPGNGETTHVLVEEKTGQMKSFDVWEHQGSRIGGFYKPKRPKAAPVKSPRISGHKVFKEGEGQGLSPMSEILAGQLKPQTGVNCLGQGPVSSLDCCWGNLANLMQELNGPILCEELSIQKLETSLLEKGRIENNNSNWSATKNFSNCGSKDPVGPMTLKRDLYSQASHKSFQEVSVLASQILSKPFVEFCPVKAGPAVFQSQAALIANGPFVGQISCQRNEDPQHSSWRPEQLSLASIDLEKAMSLDEIEEQLLLSGSVDFSPWCTEKLPDVSCAAATVERTANCSMECDPSCWDGTGIDCEGRLRPVYCHVKKESEWLLRGNKFKRKSKAYEKRRTGKGKGKQKKSLKKPFNPVALPPRHTTPRRHLVSARRPATTSVLPRVGTGGIPPPSPVPGTLRFKKRELKMENDASAKWNLTTRSLPAQFAGSVTAEEVQKWLRRDTANYTSALPNESPSREVMATSRHQSRLAGYKRPDVLELGPGQRGKLLAKAVVKFPDLGNKEASCREKTVQPVLESRRRPASAGSILKC